MKNLICLTIIMCMMILISCDESNPTNSNNNEVVVGSGTITTETLTLSAFHTVVLESVGDIRITSGAEQAVTVDADDNVHQHLNLSVSNGILTIGTEDNISFSNVNIDYFLTMTDLAKVSIVGVGNLSIPGNFEADLMIVEAIGAGNINVNLTVDTLTTNLIGAGNFFLSGSAYKHKVLLAGAGGINSFGLETNLTDVTLAGVGNIQVDVSQTLSALISGFGNIYYQGTPTVDATITGIGSIIQDN